MGYFGGLQKCARYYDGTAYRWGAWVNTGSAAAGADYAAEDGLCVVYRAQAYYTGGESALLPLSVATNFINPQSTGNPSTACCYLYTFDPTNGGDARISAPPAGYAASAGPAAFSASVVGSYISFGFPAPEGKPAALYFWFTSAGSYAGFGSNQIYHYATGNWSGTLQTGTRTPAISAAFPARAAAAEQLTKELADLRPAYIYVPAMLMAEEPKLVLPFVEKGTVPVAVLPRIINDRQMKEVYSTLQRLFDYGVNEALVGNLGQIMMARAAGMKLRGDFGLNAFNSYTLEMLNQMGFLSATASFELRIAQVKDMAKPLDTELIIYGRLPLMVSDQCIIKESAGRCACQTPAQMADRMGSVFPVVKEYGCRNVVYNAHKLYLADKKEDLYSAGLWGLRMMFTTESARECVEVAKGHMGLSDYKPNVLTRGLYYRGVD